MEVTFDEAKLILDELINGKISREHASEWAYLRQNAEDAGNLIYKPPQEEARIWKAIIYLLGVDLKDDPVNYLHTVDDFIFFRTKLEL